MSNDEMKKTRFRVFIFLIVTTLASFLLCLNCWIFFGLPNP